MPEDPLDNLAITPGEDGSLLRLRVVPGSPKSCIEGLYGDRLKVRVKAPPEKGKANRELIRFLASILDTHRAKVTIVGGSGGRDKVVQIAGCSPGELRRRLAKVFKPKEKADRLGT